MLLIAGDGSLQAALEAEAARLNLGASCRLLGHCNDVGAGASCARSLRAVVALRGDAERGAGSDGLRIADRRDRRRRHRGTGDRRRPRLDHPEARRRRDPQRRCDPSWPIRPRRPRASARRASVWKGTCRSRRECAASRRSTTRWRAIAPRREATPARPEAGAPRPGSPASPGWPRPRRSAGVIDSSSSNVFGEARGIRRDGTGRRHLGRQPFRHRRHHDARQAAATASSTLF